MQQFTLRDVTDDVKKIVRFAQENCEKVGARFGKTAQQNRLTLNMLVDIFLGEQRRILRIPAAGGTRLTGALCWFSCTRDEVGQGPDRHVRGGSRLLQAQR